MKIYSYILCIMTGREKYKKERREATENSYQNPGEKGCVCIKQW